MKALLSIAWFIAVSLWFAAFPTKADVLHRRALKDANDADWT